METNKFGYIVSYTQICVNELEETDWDNLYKFDSMKRTCSTWIENISKSNDNPNVVSDFDIKQGETCYLVWVEYNRSDDIYGIIENKNVKMIGVFNSKKCAKQLKKAIEEQNNKYIINVSEGNSSCNDKKKFYFKTSDGQEFQYDFFEFMPTVYVKKIIME